jgi:molecular chaperone DnaK (HSP70)
MAGREKIIGIDLGTTNCAVSYVDTADPSLKVQSFLIQQYCGASLIEKKELLPSFHYEPSLNELSLEALNALWGSSTTQEGEEEERYLIGYWAKDLGLSNPSRLASSAKSWLCHSGIDRTAAILPWRSDANMVHKISPVEASARILKHIVKAWNHTFKETPLEKQEVIITIPASFDETARTLTLKAASKAGLEHSKLLEEPTAAFYSWMDNNKGKWSSVISPDDIVLVCDIGGGTTDLTLIQARLPEKSASTGKEEIIFHRIAVGEHLLLGGDNLDIAIAKFVEQKVAAKTKLSASQWNTVVRRSQTLKELLLSENAPEKTSIHIPGQGASLLKSSITAELEQEQIRKLLIETFLPYLEPDAAPSTSIVEKADDELALPYPHDKAISRHMAIFLKNCAKSTEINPAKIVNGLVMPDAILLNGGFFESPVLKERLLAVIKQFSGNQKTQNIKLLENTKLYLAVANGAAFYAATRKFAKSSRIENATPRSYYIGIASENPQEEKAVCLIPSGLREGEESAICDLTFELLIRHPVEFKLYTSIARNNDKAGNVLSVADKNQFLTLPSLRTIMYASGSKEASKVKVQLHARLTEVGTLEVWCSEAGTGKRNWKLEFDSRARGDETSSNKEKISLHNKLTLDEQKMEELLSLIREAFMDKGRAYHPGPLVKKMEKILKMDRYAWPLPLLRSMWETIADVSKSRKISDEHHGLWLNLAGFCLRPGYGLTLDDWRIDRAWALVKLRDLTDIETQHGRAEWFTFWRRIAGGLNAIRQNKIVKFLMPIVKQYHPDRKELGAGEYAQMWRLLGALECVDEQTRIELGNMAMIELKQKGLECWNSSIVFAIARIGTRVPASGQMNAVLPPEIATNWLEKILSFNKQTKDSLMAIMQLARKTGDRYRDIPEEIREKVIAKLSEQNAPEHLITLVRQGGKLEDEQTFIIGEALPPGLSITI